MTQVDKQSIMDRLNGAGQVTPTLAEALRDVSKSDTSSSEDMREQIEYIDIDLIDSDPGNFYHLSQLEELAANIETVGLQQPLRVRDSGTGPQRVVIVSGHRRRAALAKLVEEGREDLRLVPCIRERAVGSPALQELRMIYANSGTRVLTSAEVSKQAARVEELLYLLKEEGMEFPGRMRDHVAQACKVSAPKLARLKVIREKLIAEYMAMFEQDKLPEQTAYALARLPEDFQRRMFTALQAAAPSGATTEKILSKYNEGWRWDPQLTCPDGKSCKRGDVFLRRDCETSYSEFCGGYTCCLECPKAKDAYMPCDRMCSKSKAQRKEGRDKEKEAELERKRKNGRRYQEETQAHAKRLLRAIDAAGVSDDAKIAWSYYEGPLVSTIRQWAAGVFDDPESWKSARLVPGRCSNDHLAGLAKLLNCSTDFLMGLTEDIRPVLVQEEPGDLVEALEEETASADSWDDISEALDQMATPEEPARRIRWESRGRTPPVGRPILTYQLTNDGPVYRPALWDGSRFMSPNGRKELTGLQYTHWLEVPLPGSGETCQAAPLELAEGQLEICGWMPGGTFPAEPCEVVADFDVGSGEVIREVCHYFDGHFSFRINSSTIGARIDAEPVRWMWLPPVRSEEV